MQQCASPSLRRVITKNVVQVRRQEFEKFSQNLSGSSVTSWRQTKSDSCVGLGPKANGVPNGQEKQLSSTPEVTSLTFASRPDIIQTKPEISLGFQTDIKSVAENNLHNREKPPLQPKPSSVQTQNLKMDVFSFCVSDNVELNSDARDSPNSGIYSKDGNNNCKSPEQKELESSEVVLETTDSLITVPPPKPPRCLSVLGYASDRKLSQEFESPNGDYDFLANSVSVVFPTALASEINVSEQKYDEFSSTSATVDEGMPASLDTEIKIRQKSEKVNKLDFKSMRPSFPGKRKKGRHGISIQVNNPNYIHVHGSETDVVSRCPHTVRQLSENELDLNSVLRQQLIRDDLCDGVNSGRTDSRNHSPASIVLDGKDDPNSDLDSDSFKNNTQSRVKSKISNAYAVLRLPHETGESTQIDDAAEEELHDQEQHLIYVKNVRQNTSAAIAKYERVKLKYSARLFQYAMVVGLDGNETVGLKPKPLFCIPNEIPESDSFVCNFCFPDVDILEPQESYEGELFSFVLTSETGDRRYGWCKRYLPPGTGRRLPEALCIVSTIGECGMYEQLLRCLQEFRAISMECTTDLMAVAYARPMPAPNKEVYIRTELPGLGRQTIILKRALNSSLVIVPFTRLVEHLSIPVLLQVFGALLLERKIIFCASSLNTLSSCIGAMVALLHPFEWQHTYVTVLTMSLIDIVEAPTPYIVGILTKMKPFLEDFDLSEVLLVDLDNHSILKGIGDESRIIPKKIQRALTTALLSDDYSDVQNVSPSGTSKRNRVASDATIREAFLRLFVETCAHYKDFILEEEGEETTFQREQFVKAVHSRSIRLFLDWFTQTQMFEVFISGKLSENVVSSGDFDQRIQDYREEMESVVRMNLGRSKKKTFGKRISAFFRESGDKIKQRFQRVYI